VLIVGYGKTMKLHLSRGKNEVHAFAQRPRATAKRRSFAVWSGAGRGATIARRTCGQDQRFRRANEASRAVTTEFGPEIDVAKSGAFALSECHIGPYYDTTVESNGMPWGP
jgi:hypothetical protein